MSSRRDFLKTMLTGAGVLALRQTGLSNNKSLVHKITILHTNDTHSQIEPLSTSHPRFPGRGGYAARAALIKQIRAEGNPVLLFDSGDYFQGTPYYNMYKGEVEMKLMSEMGYTAVTIGNHEFDNGLKGLGLALQNADFDVISSNYVFHDEILKGRVRDYKIYDLSGIKIGVFGLGINPQGLVAEQQFGNTDFVDPIRKAAEKAYFLKNKEKCNLVICLSHLGLSSNGNNIGDFDLAKQSKNIDVVLGGHSHTLLNKPIYMRNSDGEQVIICQNGYAGVQMSRVDCLLGNGGEKIFVDGYTTNIFKNQ